MEQYPIPQFIEQEAKIIFFLTFKQFFILIGAGVVCFFFYFLFPFSLFVIVALIVFAIAGIVGFVKINDMPVEKIILNYFNFSIGSRDYTWRKKESALPYNVETTSRIQPIENVTPLTSQTSRLKNVKRAVELR